MSNGTRVVHHGGSRGGNRRPFLPSHAAVLRFRPGFPEVPVEGALMLPTTAARSSTRPLALAVVPLRYRCDPLHVGIQFRAACQAPPPIQRQWRWCRLGAKRDVAHGWWGGVLKRVVAGTARAVAVAAFAHGTPACSVLTELGASVLGPPGSR
jgi:hypothetical protein